MHAFDTRLTLGAVALAVMITVGCRGTQPFGGPLIEVTQQSNHDPEQLDAPRQRLATAQPRGGADREPARPGGSLNSRVDTVAWQEDQQNGTPIRSRHQASQAPRRNGSQHDRAAQATLTDHAPHHSADSSINATEADDLMVAFKDYPPEVQREALRQLVALTARSAARSSQPASPNQALATRLAELPTLPDTPKPAGQTPARKLAVGNPDTTSAVSDQRPQPSETKSADDAVRGTITDIATTELATSSPIEQRSTTTNPATQDPTTDDTQPGQRRVAADSTVRPAVVTESDTGPAVQQASSERAGGELPKYNDSVESPGDGINLSDAASKDLFAALLAQLAREADNESEADRASRLIKLRHLMVLSGNPDGAVAEIDGMSESEQEFLRHQLLGLWTIIDPQGHPVPRRRISTAMPQIRDAAKYAAAATDSLEVRSLAFCTEIESYGQVKPFDRYRFQPGQQVILYCEIENFTAQRTDDGFATHLQGSYDLFDENGKKVVSQLLPADEQLSANYLRDYFIAYQMYLPDQLESGKYRLQLTMEDVHGKKYGQSSVDLEIKQ